MCVCVCVCVCVYHYGNLCRPPNKHFNLFLSEFLDTVKMISTKLDTSLPDRSINIDLFGINKNTTSELSFNIVISATFKPLVKLHAYQLLNLLLTIFSLLLNVFWYFNISYI